MNWIDCSLLAILCFAALRGFTRGFILELCGLIGLVLGIWGAIHFHHRLASWLGIQDRHEAISFLIAVLVILVAVHFLGVALTKVIEAAELSLPNKLGGTLLGAVRTAFTLSVLLNVLAAGSGRGLTPLTGPLQNAALAPALRSFAPAIIPELGETKWVKKAIKALEHGAVVSDP